MELEYFVKPGTDEKWLDYWVKERFDWYVKLGIRKENLRLRQHGKDELAHYAKCCTDIEYLFPMGWGELQGIANRGDYDLCIQRMERILKGDPGNSRASHYLKEASDKKAAQLAEKQILEGIRAAQQAFEGKAYQKCMEEATRVIELDPDNEEARKYLSLARMQVIPQEIQAVVNQYIQAFNSQNLFSFYQETCSPDLYQKIKNDVELIMSIYSNFRAVASNLNIRFKEINQAEASFSIISTAELKPDGRKQVLFEGTYVWDMEKQGDRWKIIRTTAQPVRKEQLKKEDS
jgi:tetratricopeptide (TPR) repeat protein